MITVDVSKDPIKHCVCKEDYNCEIYEYLKSYTCRKSLTDDSVLVNRFY